MPLEWTEEHEKAFRNLKEARMLSDCPSQIHKRIAINFEYDFSSGPSCLTGWVPPT